MLLRKPFLIKKNNINMKIASLTSKLKKFCGFVVLIFLKFFICSYYNATLMASSFSAFIC